MCRFHPVKPASSPQAPVEARHEGSPPSLWCLWCKSSRSNASRKYVELEVRQNEVDGHTVLFHPACVRICITINTSCLFLSQYFFFPTEWTMKVLLDHLPALTLPAVILPASFISGICALTDSGGVCNLPHVFVQHGVRFKSSVKSFLFPSIFY